MGGGKGISKLNVTVYGSETLVRNPENWDDKDEFELAAEQINSFFTDENTDLRLKTLIEAYENSENIIHYKTESGKKKDEKMNEKLNKGRGIKLPTDITVSIKAYQNATTYNVGDSFNSDSIAKGHTGAFTTHNKISHTHTDTIFKVNVPKGYKKGIMTRGSMADFATRGHSATAVTTKEASIGGKYILGNGLKGKVTGVMRASSGAQIVYITLEK